MDLQFIMRHLFCGYLPAAALLGLYLILLQALERRQGVVRTCTLFLFCLYLVGILVMTGICIRGSWTPQIVWIPFRDMVSGPVDTVLNVLLFIPLGFFLPFLYGRYERIRMTAAAGFLIALTVEAVQMFGYGASDINDLITNTAGTCMGFFIYKRFAGIAPEKWIRQARMEKDLPYPEPAVLWAGAVLVMLTVQVSIFHALF
ncbi:MAG: VanZ family protein [Solobacterium sp.]|nr:VanZ family protein [Solobacterium sp.]